MRQAIIVVIVFALFTVITFCSYAKQHRLSFVPNGMGVSKIIYVKEDSSGFGPGAYEIGIILYELPVDTAKEIQKNGIKYFSQLLPRKRQSGDALQGLYEQWLPTPVPKDTWLGRPEKGRAQSFLAGARTAYYYGLGMEIDPEIEKDIEESITKPGSYFAYGRSGLIIVDPARQHIIYAYR